MHWSNLGSKLNKWIFPAAHPIHQRINIPKYSGFKLITFTQISNTERIIPKMAAPCSNPPPEAWDYGSNRHRHYPRENPAMHHHRRQPRVGPARLPPVGPARCLWEPSLQSWDRREESSRHLLLLGLVVAHRLLRLKMGGVGHRPVLLLLNQYQR